MYPFFVAAFAAGLSIGAITGAQALNTRTWVSGSGADNASCGAIAAPCRTLQYAHDQTSAGGEINFRDSAGYGSVVITKSLSIVAQGVMAGVLSPAGGVAVTINAGASDVVVLKGLAVEGAGVGYNGIVFKSGSKLTIADCFVSGFVNNNQVTDSGTGVLLESSVDSTVSMSDTTVSGNRNVGVQYSMPVSRKGSFIATRLIVDGNSNGMVLESNTSASLVAEITDSTLSNNGNTGVLAVYPGTFVTVDNSRVFRNSIGVYALSSAVLFLRRSTIFGNTQAGAYIYNSTGYTYRDNSINGNGKDVDGNTALTTAPLQ